MMRMLMGKKRGMMQRFDKNGNVVTCTVVEIEPNVVTQLKTKANDGYNAVQVGFEEVTAKDPRRLEERTTKPLRGHFARAEVTPRRFLGEFRVEEKDLETFTLGQTLTLDVFANDQFVDVTGTSKGKGFQGVIKLHKMAGGPAAHGSGFHRHMGSTGMRSTPGRCFKGGPRASQMGNERVTVQNLRIVGLDAEKNVMFIEGAVPGARGQRVFIKTSKKKTLQKTK